MCGDTAQQSTFFALQCTYKLENDSGYGFGFGFGYDCASCKAAATTGETYMASREIGDWRLEIGDWKRRGSDRRSEIWDLSAGLDAAGFFGRREGCGGECFIGMGWDGGCGWWREGFGILDFGFMD
jgi:hypothetical protein